MIKDKGLVKKLAWYVLFIALFFIGLWAVDTFLPVLWEAAVLTASPVFFLVVVFSMIRSIKDLDWEKMKWRLAFGGKNFFIVVMALIVIASCIRPLVFWKEKLMPILDPGIAETRIEAPEVAGTTSTTEVPIYADSPETLAELERLKDEKSALLSEKEELQAQLTEVSPESLPIPKEWSEFNGGEAMALAMKTFGNIRIKVLYDRGRIPTVEEATLLVQEKPRDITLSTWIGNIEEVRYWPMGIVSPNAGDWGVEVFVAKNSAGSAMYYYIVPDTGEVAHVDSKVVKDINAYWFVMDTPAYRE